MLNVSVLCSTISHPSLLLLARPLSHVNSNGRAFHQAPHVQGKWHAISGLVQYLLSRIFPTPPFHHLIASQSQPPCKAASTDWKRTTNMHLITVIALFFLHFGVSAARHLHRHRSYGPTTATTVLATTTVTETVGPTSMASSFPAEAYTVVAIRPDAPFHLSPVNAASFNFTLGGAAATYCPNPPTECPAGNVTAFYGSGAMVGNISSSRIHQLTLP